MDPDKTLKDIIDFKTFVLECDDVEHFAIGLAHSVDDLFTWLASGGFAPDWTKYNA